MIAATPTLKDVLAKFDKISDVDAEKHALRFEALAELALARNDTESVKILQSGAGEIRRRLVERPAPKASGKQETARA